MRKLAVVIKRLFVGISTVYLLFSIGCANNGYVSLQSEKWEKVEVRLNKLSSTTCDEVNVTITDSSVLNKLQSTLKTAESEALMSAGELYSNTIQIYQSNDVVWRGSIVEKFASPTLLIYNLSEKKNAYNIHNISQFPNLLIGQAEVDESYYFFSDKQKMAECKKLRSSN
jgi:hypothetical protein